MRSAAASRGRSSRRSKSATTTRTGSRSATPAWRDLSTIDVILARKDPPFDDQFLYDTMVLELAEKAGALVVNRPQGLRDANEKLFSLHFPECAPPTMIARDSGEFAVSSPSTARWC